MRGKTNATNGVHLNATAVNKTVKSGQITAGDFVEYYIEPNIISQSGHNLFISNIGDYTVTQKGNALALFKDAAQVHEFNTYDILYAEKVDTYIAFFTSNGEVGVLTIDTDNDELVPVDIISTSFHSSSYDDGYSITAGNGQLMILETYNYSSTRTNLRFGLIDISSEGELSNFTLTTITRSHSMYRPKIVYAADDFFILNSGACNRLIIEQNREITFDTNHLTISFDGGNHPMLQYDNSYIYGWNGSGQNTSRIFCVTFNDGVATSKAIDMAGVAVTNIENNLFVTKDYNNTTLRLYSFDRSTSEINLLDTLIASSPYLGGGSNGVMDNFINGTDVFVKLYSTSTSYDLRLFKIQGDHIIEIPEVDYVVPYDGVGDPIGVAQTDGNTNDVIPIYVPTASV